MILPNELKFNDLPIIDYKRIAKGGQKTVFVATNSKSEECIIKEIIADTEFSKARILREIDICTSIKGKYFPNFYSSYHKGNKIYIVEQYIDGQQLRELISKELQYNQISKIIYNILLALEIIEQYNLVHRDIKPENILLSQDELFLIDFGIARLLDAASITSDFSPNGPMTIGYAAPEQIKNRKRQISIRTDLFSLGVVSYEMLTGSNPFVAPEDSLEIIIDKTLRMKQKDLTQLGYPEDLSLFINMCLEKEPHRRPNSVNAAINLFKKI